jgi:hypothetical protein
MFSICIITAKQDQRLKRAIDSVSGLGEMIVVDTYSTRNRGSKLLYIPLE